MAANELGITLTFEGTGVDEKAIVVTVKGDKAPAVQAGDVVVQVDPRYFRPAEVETLLGDPSKAKLTLGWTPKIDTETLCREMVQFDLENAKRSALLIANGFPAAISSE